MSSIIKLKGRVDAQRLEGKINLVPSENAGGPLQAKTVYPIHSEQSIAPDEDYYGLAVVKVLAVPRIKAVETSVASDDANVVENVVNISCRIEITAEDYTPPTHALYNGIRLPILPQDVLKDYPYAIMITGSDHYYLVLSNSKYYKQSNGYLKINGSVYDYFVRFANMETDTEWTLDGNGAWQHDVSKLVWSNYDVPVGSASSTEICFKGSEPILVE